MELTIYGGGLCYPFARHALSFLVSILNLISYTYLHVCKGGCLYVWITVPACKWIRVIREQQVICGIVKFVMILFWRYRFMIHKSAAGLKLFCEVLKVLFLTWTYVCHNWRIKPTRCYLLFYCTSYRLKMFWALLCPSGARDYVVDYHIVRFVLGLLYVEG